MNNLHKTIFLVSSTSIIVLFAGFIGYYFAPHVIALVISMIIGIGIGWLPGGKLGIFIRILCGLFMAFYCGKYFKTWIEEKID